MRITMGLQHVVLETAKARARAARALGSNPHCEPGCQDPILGSGANLSLLLIFSEPQFPCLKNGNRSVPAHQDNNCKPVRTVTDT